MEVKVEELAPCKRKLEWVVPRDDVEEQLGEKLEEIRNTVIIPGFRRGRAPVGLLQKRFGDQIRDDVKQSLMASSFSEALEENGLTPLGEPEVDSGDIDAEEGLKVEATVNVKPAFEVEDYTQLTVTKPKGDVTDEMIDTQIERLRESKAVLKPIGDEGLVEDDEIAVDLEITAEGLDPVQEEDVDITLADPAVEGLEFTNLGTQLAGARIGESREVEAQTTDEFAVEDHRGKPVQVRLTVLDAKRKALPDLDDEFAKIYRMETMDELRSDIRERLSASSSQRATEALRRNLEDVLLGQYSFELPQDIVDLMAESTVMRERQRLESQGISPAQIDEHLEELRNAGEDVAMRQLKLTFIFEAIAEKEKIFVTDADVEQRIELMGRVYGMPAARFKREMEESGRLSSLRGQMRDDKTAEFLLDKVQLQEDEEAEAEAEEKEE